MIRFLPIFSIALLFLSACGKSEAEEIPKSDAIIVSFEGADSENVDKADHGERLSAILNCQGCHGSNLQGRPFPAWWPEPSGIWASNITLIVPKLTDSELEALIRHGEHPERDDLWFMPSSSFQHLSQNDMDALIAYLRSMQPAGMRSPDPAPTQYLNEIMGRGNLLMTSEKIRRHNAAPLPELGQELALGRYIVEATCTECHGSDLKGMLPFAPPMTVAGAYDDPAFIELLTTGKALGDRNIGVMSRVGPEQISRLTSTERSQVVQYIRAWLSHEVSD